MEDLEVKLVNFDEFSSTCKKWNEERASKKGGEEKVFPVPHPTKVEEVHVCYFKNTPLYCCFAWTTKSNLCFIGFPMSNPSIPYKFRKGLLSFLFSEMAASLKERGFTNIWTSSGTKPVEKALVENTFDLVDPGVNVYIKSM